MRNNLMLFIIFLGTVCFAHAQSDTTVSGVSEKRVSIEKKKKNVMGKDTIPAKTNAPNIAVNIQFGKGYSSTIIQKGSGHQTVHDQAGNKNTIVTSQEGKNNNSKNMQSGDRNTIVVNQKGKGNTSKVTQKGKGSTIILNQSKGN